MNSNLIGTEIARLRKELGITQKQLSEGICTQATISMIENSEIVPGLEILSSIALKLKQPINYFTNLLLYINYTYIHKFVYDIEELTIKQQFNTVYKIVKNELEKSPEDLWFQVFLKWQLFLSSYHLKKISLNNALAKIKELALNTPELILSKNFLAARLYNTIAFLYALNGDNKKSLFYYNKINVNTNFRIESPRLNENIYYIRIIYNKTKTLYDMKNYEEAILSCKEGINKSIELENMSVIGNFFYYLGQCYEKQDMKKEDIASAYHKAILFFELLNRENYINILKSEKEEFL